MHIKPFEELTIQDDFMFQKVMRNKRICKATIERLLDIQIKDIPYLEEEKSLHMNPDSKGIRLDVYVNDVDGTVFNVEMQTTKNMEELVKRVRYYQSIIDLHNIEKGKITPSSMIPMSFLYVHFHYLVIIFISILSKIFV